MKIIKKTSTFILILIASAQIQSSEYKSYAVAGEHYLKQSQDQVSHGPAMAGDLLNAQQRVSTGQPTIQPSKSQKPEKILFTPKAPGLFDVQSHVVSMKGFEGSCYYPYARIAYVQKKSGDRQYYQNVTEHTPNPSIGPADISPNKNNPKLQLIGTYQNQIPQSKNGQRLIGAPSSQTQLYGEISQEIPVIPVKNPKVTEDGTYNPIDATAEITDIKLSHCDPPPAEACTGPSEIKKKYVNVQLYFGGGRTPLTVQNPKLEMIGTIPNPFAKKTVGLGAQSETIILFGIDSSKLSSEKYRFDRTLKLASEHKQDMHHDEGSEEDDQKQQTEAKPSFFDEFEPGLPS